MADIGNTIEQETLIEALRRVLSGKKIDLTDILGLDEDSFFELCQRHRVSALVAAALEDPDDKWKRAKINSIKRTVLFDKERSKIYSFFDKNGIWYCPLKGILLKDYYPAYGLREMADNDILYDDSRTEEVHKYMISNGYYCETYMKSNHDVYQKEPVYNFELHRSLFFDNKNNKKLYDYYKNVKESLIRKSEGSFEYCFTDEDFYVYFMSHNHKHFSNSGSGIRTLVDIYLYLQNHENLDWAYINMELSQLGFKEEEAAIRELAIKLFSHGTPVLNVEEKKLLDYILFSGVYGNKNNAVSHILDSYKNKKNYKARYLFRRVFPDEDTMKQYFPFFYKHRWAVPFLILYRLFKAVFFKFNVTLKEIGIVYCEGREEDE